MDPSSLKIDWQSSQTHIFLNPSGPKLNLKELPDLKSHIWLSTSGTTAKHGEAKLVGLSKQAFLTSAEAVVQHLQICAKDSWFLSLPDFHVGGLSIYARAYLSGAKILPWWKPERKWSVRRFFIDLCNSQASLVSVVPTQIFDLVNLELEAPKALRAVVVGGGRLTESFYKKARRLGWPVLPSYGLSEACSQVATASLPSLEMDTYPDLKILPHIEVSANDKGFLQLQGDSLLSQYFLTGFKGNKTYDPKRRGVFTTSELGEVKDKSLKVFGREDNFVKISGEKVDLLALQSVLEDCKQQAGFEEEAVIVALEDDRLEVSLCLAFAGLDSKRLAQLERGFNQKVLPFEKIRQSCLVPFIPRTELGKIRMDELKGFMF